VIAVKLCVNPRHLHGFTRLIIELLLQDRNVSAAKRVLLADYFVALGGLHGLCLDVAQVVLLNFCCFLVDFFELDQD